MKVLLILNSVRIPLWARSCFLGTASSNVRGSFSMILISLICQNPFNRLSLEALLLRVHSWTSTFIGAASSDYKQKQYSDSVFTKTCLMMVRKVVVSLELQIALIQQKLICNVASPKVPQTVHKHNLLISSLEKWWVSIKGSHFKANYPRQVCQSPTNAQDMDLKQLTTALDLSEFSVERWCKVFSSQRTRMVHVYHHRLT